MSYDSITNADNLHRANMVRGSETLRCAIEVARGGPTLPLKCLPGTKLLWGHRPAKWTPDETSNTSRYGQLALARLIAREKRAEEQRTFRDPCPLCAVRADIGCKHRRAA